MSNRFRLLPAQQAGFSNVGQINEPGQQYPFLGLDANQGASANPQHLRPPLSSPPLGPSSNRYTHVESIPGDGTSTDAEFVSTPLSDLLGFSVSDLTGLHSPQNSNIEGTTSSRFEQREWPLTQVDNREPPLDVELDHFQGHNMPQNQQSDQVRTADHSFLDLPMPDFCSEQRHGPQSSPIEAALPSELSEETRERGKPKRQVKVQNNGSKELIEHRNSLIKYHVQEANANIDAIAQSTKGDPDEVFEQFVQDLRESRHKDQPGPESRVYNRTPQSRMSDGIGLYRSAQSQQNPASEQTYPGDHSACMSTGDIGEHTGVLNSLYKLEEESYAKKYALRKLEDECDSKRHPEELRSNISSKQDKYPCIRPNCHQKYTDGPFVRHNQGFICDRLWICPDCHKSVYNRAENLRKHLLSSSEHASTYKNNKAAVEQKVKEREPFQIPYTFICGLCAEYWATKDSNQFYSHVCNDHYAHGDPDELKGQWDHERAPYPPKWPFPNVSNDSKLGTRSSRAKSGCNGGDLRHDKQDYFDPGSGNGSRGGKRHYGHSNNRSQKQQKTSNSSNKSSQQQSKGTQSRENKKSKIVEVEIEDPHSQGHDANKQDQNKALVVRQRCESDSKEALDVILSGSSNQHASSLKHSQTAYGISEARFTSLQRSPAQAKCYQVKFELVNGSIDVKRGKEDLNTPGGKWGAWSDFYHNLPSRLLGTDLVFLRKRSGRCGQISKLAREYNAVQSWAVDLDTRG